MKYAANVTYQLLDSSNMDNQTCYFLCFENSNFNLDSNLDLNSTSTNSENLDEGGDLMYLVWILTHICACLLVAAMCRFKDCWRSRQRQNEPDASLKMENNDDNEEQRSNLNENNQE